MSTTPLVPIVSSYDITSVWSDLYEVTAPTNRIGIDAVVFNNYSNSNATIDVRIVQSGTASELNEIITNKDIRAKGNYLAPSMIGQSVAVGGVIQAKANLNNSVNVNITATKIDQ